MAVSRDIFPDVSTTHGFQLDRPPASRLPESHAAYEGLVRNTKLHIAVQSLELRRKVDNLPTLNISGLYIPHQRRAYCILPFVAHGYIWGDGTSTITELPPQLRIPLEALSDQLGIKPLGTYASTVLWNC
ncbi:Indoleamine 2,3-dioxygenase [Clohesyomyces aquaticus]|uniref:Indoleamine 2,3-dioxygenase n=1 Tax=Clohesyomyces aquaticus TaxID=1231657 RepID=A0A1Y1ZXC9_9PLEO|nr:Indoleamine 2,3-dioxygenase [Clohesyomyces aquaticus]